MLVKATVPPAEPWVTAVTVNPVDEPETPLSFAKYIEWGRGDIVEQR